MIDFGKILKRAWQILWNYKVLWIFGVLLALTVGGSSFNPRAQFNNNNNNYQGVTPPTNPDVQQMNQWFQDHVEPLARNPGQHIWTFVLIALAFILFLLLIGAIVALIRYPSETAVIRMANDYEDTGEKLRFGQAWKLGWNHRALRLWWVDFLLEGIPGLIILVLLFGSGTNLVIQAIRNDRAGIIAGVVLLVLCVLVTILIGLVEVFVRLLRQFFARKLALEDTGTKAAFREGWAMFKRNWKSTLLMWLILVGIKIGFGIAMLVAAIVLIPAYIILAIPALLVAAIPGLLVFGIANIFTTTLVAAILGGLAAIIPFIMIVFLPLTFLQGWYLVYDTNAWTLAYREMKAMNAMAPALPEPMAPTSLPPITE